MNMNHLTLDEKEIREIVTKILSQAKDPLSRPFFYAVFNYLDLESLKSIESIARMEIDDRRWRDLDLPSVE